MIQVLKKRWVYHTLTWILGYLTLTLMTFFGEDNTNSFFSSLSEPLVSYIPIIIITYLSFWVKENLFDARRYVSFTLAVIVIVGIGTILYESLELLIRGELGNSRTQNITNFIFLQAIAIGLQYLKRGIINQYQLQELKAKTAMTELNALKAQINPHFLFNTLNNIYGMNNIDPEKGSEMIMELSDVMRYHLEFSKQGQVRLEDEIHLLRSYIKLEQLRLRDTCEVQVDFEDADERIMISPLLFVPFVENAFKHGTHSTKDCFVHIKLTTTPSRLLFTVKNSLIANRKVVKTNIGLQNTKRRLELLFPNKHLLKIVKNEVYYLVELSIEL